LCAASRLEQHVFDMRLAHDQNAMVAHDQYLVVRAEVRDQAGAAFDIE
jgi:hypothetical protein